MKHINSLFLALCTLLGLLVPMQARAQTYSNPAYLEWLGPFVFPSSDWAYPSVINVVGGPTSITSFSVTLKGFYNYGGPNVVLVSPTGQKFALLRPPTTYAPSTDIDLTFTATASGSVPNPMVTGTYLPTSVRTTNLPSPAPVGPYTTNLATLNTTNSNGTWSLYTTCESPTNGHLRGGWSITFNGITTGALPTSFTYQGKLTGGPTNGEVALRVALWDSLTSTNTANRIAGPITYPHVAIADNLLTQQFDFGAAIQQSKAIWLEIEVATSANGPFTTLTPRQPITGAPLAHSLRGVWVDSNNNVGLGTNAPTQKLTVVGSVLATSYLTPSSARFKECIEPIDDALVSLQRLTGVRFDWKPEYAAQRDHLQDMGFIAEDVAQVFPEVVARDEQGRVAGVDYARLTAVAVQAIKEQQRQIDALTQRLQRLEESAKARPAPESPAAPAAPSPAATK